MEGTLFRFLERSWLTKDDGGHDSLPCDFDVGADAVRDVAGVDGRAINRRRSRLYSFVQRLLAFAAFAACSPDTPGPLAAA